MSQELDNMDQHNTDIASGRGVEQITAHECASNSQDIQNTNNVVNTQHNVTGDSITYNVPVNVYHYPQSTQQQPAEVPRLEFQMVDPVNTFRGRQKELNDVFNAFNFHQEKDECLEYNLVVVCGYGGIGKTEFARAFIKKYKHKLNNVVWINAEFETSIQDSFDKLQNKLEKCSEQQDVYNCLNSDKCLFVFDNSQNWTQIEPFLPKKTNNSLFLVTSQCEQWDPYQIIQLNKLDEHDAENVIKSVLSLHSINISKGELKNLISKIETIPLVLQITTGYITKEIVRSRKIKKNYNMINIIQKLNIESQLLINTNPCTTMDRYKKSIFNALLPTLNKIHNEQDEEFLLTMKMVGVAAYLNADYIYIDILRRLVKSESEELFDISLANLIEFSLFQLSDEKIRIHRTVQNCLRYYHREKETVEYLKLALSILLVDHCSYDQHHMIVIEHCKIYLNTLISFYNDNMCVTLHTNFARHVSRHMITQLINADEYDLIQNSEFIYSLAKCKRDDIMHMLETHAINFNILDTNGLCALHYACLRNEECNLILDIIFNFTSTLIHKLSIIKSLITHGSDVNMLTFNGDTVLHILCNNYPKRDDWTFVISAMLIKFGADLTIKNQQQQTVALLARECGLYRTLALLETVNYKVQYLQETVAKYKLYNILLSLIDANFCNVNDEDESGNTILHVLAGLDPQAPDDEIEILYTTLELVQVYKADVRTVNIHGETATDVAQRCGLQKLTKALRWLGPPPGHHIFNSAVHRNKIRNFRFVSSQDRKHVDDVNNSGNTILLVVCDLKNDEATDEDVVKLAVHLVIWYKARVIIRNAAGDTAADVARHHGRWLLADFLETLPTIPERYARAPHLVSVALKHRDFDLLKYTWWRYLYDTDEEITYGWPGERGCEVLRALCDVQDEYVHDHELISVAECINLKQIAKYERTNDVYLVALEIAKRHNRKEFVSWLKGNS